MQEDDPNQTVEKYSQPILALILLAGALLTGAYLFQLHQTPFADLLMVDAKTYHLKALTILQEGWIGKNVSYQAPLYPYFLAVIYTLFGVNWLGVQILQAALFLLTILILYRLGSDLFDTKVGLLCAALMAFYGVVIYYTGLLLKTTLSVFFTGLFLLTLLKAEKFRSRLFFFLGGLLLGLLMTLRENMALVLPAILVWIIFLSRPDLKRHYRSRIMAAVLFLCGLLLFLSPFILRNYIHSGELIITSYQGGANFYLGNNPSSRGFYTRLPFVRANPEWEEKDFKAEAEKRTGRPLSPSQVSRFWFRQAWGHFQEDPFLFPKLFLLKIYILFNNYEVPDNYDFAFMKSLTPSLKGGFISYGLILPLALMGLFLSRKKSSSFLLLYIFLIGYALSVILFYVNSRYRMPLVPALIPFAAYTLMEGRAKWRVWKGKEKMLALLVFLFLNLLTFSPTIGNSDFSFPHFKLGLEYEKKGLWDQALLEFRRALALQPEFPWANHGLGRVLERKGEIDSAVLEYQKALQNNPDYWEARVNLAIALGKKGRIEDALAEYRKILTLKPDLPEAHNNLGALYEQKGWLEPAAQAYKKAIQLRPGFVEAHNNLGVFYLKQGRLQQAEYEFKLALKLYPNHPIVQANLEKLKVMPKSRP